MQPNPGLQLPPGAIVRQAPPTKIGPMLLLVPMGSHLNGETFEEARKQVNETGESRHVEFNPNAGNFVIITPSVVVVCQAGKQK